MPVVNYASRYEKGFPMRDKSDWFPLLTKFILRFERQYDVRVKVIQSDNEFDTNKIRSWCAKRGIRQQITEPDESYSNGKVERRHRTLFDGMRAMMFDAAQVPRFLWSEALRHQSWLRNLLPTRTNGGNMSPIGSLTGHKPNLSIVLKWGQRVTVHVKIKSMGTRKKCEHGIFIGYDDKVKRHRVLNASNASRRF